MSFDIPITVLMPAYNPEEKSFREAIESILNQTYVNFEFIIINDGSTNNTEDIILSYNDKRLKYFKNECNIGLVATLNKGLDLAKGKYIARLDADDYSYPARLYKQFEYMELHPECGVCGTYAFDYDYLTIPQNPRELKIFQRYVRNCIWHSSAMIRKSILEINNIKYKYDYFLSEDLELWSNISRYSELGIIPERLIAYNDNPKGISNKNKLQQCKVSSKVMVENMIKDYPCDYQTIKNLIDKSMRNEYNDKHDYLKPIVYNVVEDILKKVSPQYKTYVGMFVTGCYKNILTIK